MALELNFVSARAIKRHHHRSLAAEASVSRLHMNYAVSDKDLSSILTYKYPCIPWQIQELCNAVKLHSSSCLHVPTDDFGGPLGKGVPSATEESNTDVPAGTPH